MDFFMVSSTVCEPYSSAVANMPSLVIAARVSVPRNNQMWRRNGELENRIPSFAWHVAMHGCGSALFAQPLLVATLASGYPLKS
jgi:hypothetical protein